MTEGLPHRAAVKFAASPVLAVLTVPQRCRNFRAGTATLPGIAAFPGFHLRKFLQRWGVLAPAGCAQAPPKLESPADSNVGMRTVPELTHGLSVGYLDEDELPDSMQLLPLYPTQDSPASAQDLEVQRNARALLGTPRWELAAIDANLDPVNALATFDCALGVSINAAEAPH